MHLRRSSDGVASAGHSERVTLSAVPRRLVLLQGGQGQKMQIERARPCVVRDCARPVVHQRVVRLGDKDVDVAVCDAHAGVGSADSGDRSASAPATTA